MGGVDRSDQSVATWRLKRSFIKWYQSAIMRLLDVAVANASVLHQHHWAKRHKHHSSRLFMEDAIHQLLGRHDGNAIPKSVAVKPTGWAERRPRSKHAPPIKALTTRKCCFCYTTTPFVCEECPEPKPALCQKCSAPFHFLNGRSGEGEPHDWPNYSAAVMAKVQWNRSWRRLQTAEKLSPTEAAMRLGKGGGQKALDEKAQRKVAAAQRKAEAAERKAGERKAKGKGRGEASSSTPLFGPAADENDAPPLDAKAAPGRQRKGRGKASNQPGADENDAPPKKASKNKR